MIVRLDIVKTGLRFILLPLLLFVAADASAETRWQGLAGIDLSAYGFTGNMHDTSYTYRTTRSLSNHFVDLSVGGDLVSKQFADFLLRGKVLGAFSQSSTAEESNNFYIEPDLTDYYGSLVLLPERSYPLRLFMGSQLDRELEYESQNRSQTEFVQPSLGVVRRYRRESKQQGAVLDISMAENASLSAQAKKLETSSLREYDFDENRNIWVDILTFPTDPFATTHDIEIVNKLPDASVRVIVNGIDTTLAPEQYAVMPLDSGLQSALVLPLSGYNQFEFTVRVQGDQSWRIVYNEPPSPLDQKADETSSRVQLDLGEQGTKSLVAFFDHSDRFDPFSGLTTVRDMANNSIEYAVSQFGHLALETGYSSNESFRGSRMSQSDKTFSHETSFEHLPRRGIAATVLHEYSRSTIEQEGAELVTDINRFRGRVGRPFSLYDYRIDLESNISLKSDNSGYETNEYRTELNNRMEIPLVGFYWRPVNRTEYSIRDQKRQDGSNNRIRTIDTKFTIDAASRRTTAVGDLSLKAEYGYRRQADEIGHDIRTLYGFELGVSRRLSRSLQLDLLAIQQWESYGGSTPQVGPNLGQNSTVRPTDHKQTWRADVKFRPGDRLEMAANYSLVDERISTITQFGGNLATTLPVIRMPLIATVSRSLRDIGDLPRQEVTNFEAELKYNYRQIDFDLEYTYSKEKLVSQTFTLYEVIATVSRNFSW